MHNAVFYRDMFMSGGVLCFFAALVNGAFDRVLHATTCVFLGLSFLVLSGLAFAYLLQRIAYAVLPDTWRPWYARRGTSLLFWAAFVIFNVSWIEFDAEALAGSKFANTVSWGSRMFVLVATELCAIPLFDWPHGWRRTRVEDSGLPRINGSRNCPPTFHRFPGP
jgi:hypothetical protein